MELRKLFISFLLFLLIFLMSMFYIYPYVKERTAYFAVNVYYPGELEYKGYQVKDVYFENKSLVIALKRGNQTNSKIVRYEPLVRIIGARSTSG